MASITSRISRLRSYGGVVVGLVILSVTLVTSLAFWWDKLGGLGMVVIAAAVSLGLLTVIVMPESAWQRVSGTRGLETLGQLHEDGVKLRLQLPWVTERDGKDRLDTFEKRFQQWTEAVYEELPQRWRGTFLTTVPGTKFVADSYERASRYRNALDDRLERLSQIIAAMGGRS